MKEKGLIVIFLFVLFFIPGIIATNTPITVKTAVNHDVTISIYRVGGSDLAARYKGSAGENGTFYTVYNSSDNNNVRIIVFISKFGKKVITQNFDDVNVGSALVFDVYPENYQPPVVQTEAPATAAAENKTIDENKTTEKNIITNTTKNESSLTGLVTKNIKRFSIPSKVYYIIGGLFLAGIIVLFLVKGILKRNKNKHASEYSEESGIKVRKMSDLINKKHDLHSMSKELLEAEKKFKTAQTELNRLKNKDKIKEIEQKLEQDRKELEKLKRGD